MEKSCWLKNWREGKLYKITLVSHKKKLYGEIYFLLFFTEMLIIDNIFHSSAKSFLFCFSRPRIKTKNKYRTSISFVKLFNLRHLNGLGVKIKKLKSPSFQNIPAIHSSPKYPKIPGFYPKCRGWLLGKNTDFFAVECKFQCMKILWSVKKSKKTTCSRIHALCLN